ncbi:MAG: MBL fold metallo-hydrolase, partial [Paracoccaceae bacterium]
MTTFPVNMNVQPEVEPFFDPATNTISYVVKDPNSNSCAIVDSVMDIDYAAGKISYENADAIISYVKEKGLKVEWLIETHVHADHLSAAPYIQEKLGGKIGIGENRDKLALLEKRIAALATLEQWALPEVLPIPQPLVERAWSDTLSTLDLPEVWGASPKAIHRSDPMFRYPFQVH